ncbi:recombinase family protein [Rhizobium sp. CAU 1783]
MTDRHAITTELQAKGVDLIVTEQHIDTSTPTGRLIFTMLGAIAEFETDLRKERQLEGIAKAKEEGRYKGRPVTANGDDIRAAIKAGDRPAEVAKRFNVARSTVYCIVAEGRISQTPLFVGVSIAFQKVPQASVSGGSSGKREPNSSCG